MRGSAQAVEPARVQLTLAGPVVNLIYSGAGAKVLPAGLGFPALSGRTAVLRYSHIMPATVSMAALGGQPATLTYTAVEGDIVMPVSAGVLRMAGQSCVSGCHTDPAQANGTEIRSEGVSETMVATKGET